MKKLVAIATAGTVLSFSVLAILLTLGGVSLVTTHGISMQPAFYAGDLAVLRPGSGSYAVGDVVTYRSEQMDTVVMHRIVAVEGGRYTLQGDNNDWLDPEQPSPDQVLGELAVRIPRGGIWLQRATSPAVLGAAAFLLLICGGAVTVTRQQRRRARRAGPAPVASTVSRAMRAGSGIAFVSAAVLALGAASLGFATWTRPVAGPVTATDKESAALTFSYSADVGRSAAYDEMLVTQPHPVFRRLADRVEVVFVYESADQASASEWAAVVELGMANGWSSTVPVEVAVVGSSQRQEGRIVLDLPALHDRAEAAARAIAAEPVGDISVTVVPELQSAGSAFRAELPFVMTDTALRLVDTEPSSLTVANPSADAAVAATIGPTTIPLLGHDLRVDHGRTAALGGFTVAMLVVCMAAVLVRRARRRPETAAIRGRYAQILLRANPMVLPAGRPVVDVVAIAELARLAQRYGLLVLHWDRGGVATYVVLDDSATYRYRTASALRERTDDVRASVLASR